jgi:hypothetical protein
MGSVIRSVPYCGVASATADLGPHRPEMLFAGHQVGDDRQSHQYTPNELLYLKGGSSPKPDVSASRGFYLGGWLTRPPECWVMNWRS